MNLQRILDWFRDLLARLRGRPSGRRRGGRGGRRRRKKRAPTALGTFGARVGRHAGIYGAGQAGSLLVGLVTLAVLTRLLEPAEFGQYAIYYVFSALVAVIYTLGWVRGSLLWVFGGGGDEDDDEEDDARPEGETSTAEDKRRALGTAVVAVALIGALGTAVVAIVGPAVAELLTGDADQGRLVLIAGAAGAAGAVWMLAGAVPRRERRPQAYVLVYLARPILVLAVTVPLVAIDPEVESAVIGLAIGSALAVVLSLVTVRRSFTFAFGFVDVRNIVRLGAPFIPLILSLWVIGNGGVLFLAHYASASDVGFFRVATGVAAVASLPVSAFITAWGPLRRDPIYGAVEAERGKLAAAGVLSTYFALFSIGILLALLVGADLLVRIAPPSYEAAAPLIPLLGLGLLLRGWFRVVRRSAKFSGRRLWYIWLAVLAGFVFVAACVALIPPLGPDGAALAVVIAFASAALGMTLRSQLGADPIPLGLGRILGGLAIAGACFAAARLAGDGVLAVVVDVAAIAAYPLLLVATGIVPRDHVTPLGRVALAALPKRRARVNGRVDLDGLDETHRAVLEHLVRRRRPPEDVAPEIGMSREALETSFVAALRRVGGVGEPSAADPRIGAYLLSAAPVAARDQLWRRLAAEGADPLEVDSLSLTLERLRRAPERAWARS